MSEENVARKVKLTNGEEVYAFKKDWNKHPGVVPNSIHTVNHVVLEKKLQTLQKKLGEWLTNEEEKEQLRLLCAALIEMYWDKLWEENREVD